MAFVTAAPPDQRSQAFGLAAQYAAPGIVIGGAGLLGVVAAAELGRHLSSLQPIGHCRPLSPPGRGSSQGG
jgi:hypothetical protein